MDNLDRMYRHLVRTIRSRFPQYLTQPLNVGELHQTILPYRHHRRELGLETNEDYEMTMTELLSGARDYLAVDDRMRDTLRAELTATNPDPSAFRQFAGATVTLAPAALRSLEAGPDEDSLSRASPSGSVQRTVELPARASGDVPAAPRPKPALSGAKTAPFVTPTSQPAIAPKPVVPETGERCRSCNELLPAGRPVTFCPHCGQNITTINCPACGSELEIGWKFCPTCGRPT